MVIASTFMLIGCSNKEASGSEGVTDSTKNEDVKGSIGISFPEGDQPLVQSIIGFAKEKAEQEGYKIAFDDPKGDLNAQVSTIETWIESKQVDIVVGAVFEPEVVKTIAKKSLDADIPWITYADQIDEQTAFLSYDHEEGGYMLGEAAAEWINENLNGEAEIAILGFESGSWSRDRVVGMEKAIQEHAPNATIVAKQDALTASEAVEKTETILQGNPNLNVVLGITDDVSVGAFQALTNSGKEKDDPNIFVGGMEGTKRALELLQEGTMYRSIVALPISEIGRTMVELPINILEGNDYEEENYIEFVTLKPDQTDEINKFIEGWE